MVAQHPDSWGLRLRAACRDSGEIRDLLFAAMIPAAIDGAPRRWSLDHHLL